MSSSSRAVDYSRIRHRIKVPRLGSNTTRSRRDAARYIDLGYQVTDDYDRDLTIETLPDGTRRVVIGEDPLATYSERINRAADAGAGPSRPANLPERELTDYEARKLFLTLRTMSVADQVVGRRHVTEECNIPNCDHPVHFGGNEYGR